MTQQYLIRGGTPAGYDTVDTIAQAFHAANPSMSFAEAKQQIMRLNHLDTHDGHASCGKTLHGVVTLYAGKTLLLPEGNALGDFPLVHMPSQQCGETVIPNYSPLPDLSPLNIPRWNAAPPVAEAAPVKPLAQFIPTTRGTHEYAAAVNGYDFMYGDKPHDAAADWSMRSGKLKNGAIVPADSEGVDTKKVVTKEQLVLTRETANAGEVQYTPSQTVLINKDGYPVKVNPERDQKMEENSRLVERDGHTIAVRDGHARISLNRRTDPDYAGIWREEQQAVNLINQWNNTPDGIKAIASYRAIQEAYPSIAEAVAQGKSTTPAKDIEQLLQLNVQTALHPLVWSLSSQGVPAADTPESIQHRMQKLFDSPQFAKLSDGEKIELKADYQPYMDKLAHPKELNEAIAQRGGRGDWYNPLSDLAANRAKLDFIQDGYSDNPYHLKQTDAEKKQHVVDVGQAYAQRIWNDTIRPPTTEEVALGTGELLDTKRQAPDRMRVSRMNFLNELTTDDKGAFKNQALLEKTVNHMMHTPGSLQKVTDMLFYASRTEDGNPTVLDFNPDNQPLDKTGIPGVLVNATGLRGNKPVIDFVRNTAEKLGGEKYREKVEYDAGNPVSNMVINPAVKLATLGAVRLNVDDNQNVGLEGFPEEVKKRWETGGPAVRKQIMEAISDVAQKAIGAEISRGNPVASSSLVASLDPQLDLLHNGGEHSKNYEALIKEAKHFAPVIQDQMVEQLNAVGNVAGGMAAAAKEKVATGQLKADANHKVGMFDVAAAEKVAALPKDQQAAALAGVIASSDNPKLVTRAQVEQHVTTSAAQQSPALFSTMVANLLAKEPKGNLAGDVDRTGTRSITLSLGGLIGSTEQSDFADKIEAHADAIRAAGKDPKALNAAQAAAAKDFTAFFADKEHATARLAGLENLTGQMASDAHINAAMTNEFKAFEVADSGKFIQDLKANGKLSEKDVMQLTMIQMASPEMQAEMFQQWSQNYQATADSLHARTGISWVEMAKLALITTAAIPGGHPPGNPPLIPGTPEVCAPLCTPPVPPPVVPPILL